MILVLEYMEYNKMNFYKIIANNQNLNRINQIKNSQYVQSNSEQITNILKFQFSHKFNKKFLKSKKKNKNYLATKFQLAKNYSKNEVYYRFWGEFYWDNKKNHSSKFKQLMKKLFGLSIKCISNLNLHNLQFDGVKRILQRIRHLFKRFLPQKQSDHEMKELSEQIYFCEIYLYNLLVN